MINCAVIAEFNPFHSGHKKLIDTVRESAADIICVMSGPFVQSAFPAICDKAIRAESAILCGADAVIELPALYATASAKSFAEGALKIITKVRGVTHLAFGVSSDKDCILRIAELRIKKADKFNSLYKSYLKQGKSHNYATRAALTELYRENCGESDPALAFDDPNSILGIEYICAIDKLGANIQPYIITRRGSHLSGAYYSDDFLSATNIRKSLLSNAYSVKNYIPYNYEKVLNFAENHAPDISALKKMALFYVKSLSSEELSELRDCSKGMEFLIKEIAKNNDYDGIIGNEKLKIYGAKRLNRLFLDAVCGIKKEYLDYPFVTRLLACSGKFDFSLLPDFVKTANRDLKLAAEHNSDIRCVLGVDERIAVLYNTLCSTKGDFYNYSLVKA
ncbi:MAG: nucleotidyltransferase family protein [Clostridiales bacterium]|nr:nucleotidyltransferase family protein [Clostridiales bacterium]